jgi:hypothetical protein
MATRKKARRAKSGDPVLGELGEIKRLLMLQLINSGMQAQDIGAVLGLTKSQMSGIIPARKLKRASKS